MSQIVEFSHDEAGYLSWLDAHPDGLVLNLRQGRSAGYAVLHRASCSFISSSKRPPGSFTERGYRKLCVTAVTDLRAGLRYRGRGDGVFSSHCSFCNPP